MNPLADSLFRHSLCTTAPPTRTITCCTSTKRSTPGTIDFCVKCSRPASKARLLAWFHKLSRGSINSFNELWDVFVSQYLCTVRQKGNISSLQAILKREEESIRDITHRFEQAIQQIDIYSMDAVLQDFWRSFGLTTMFFQSLSLDSPATMEELYRRADKFSTLEDNIRAAL